MKSFSYIAVDVENKKKKGQIEAHSEGDVYDKLLKQQLYLVKLKEIKSEEITKLNNGDLSMFCRQLGTMVQAGLNITDALYLLSEAYQHKKKFTKLVLNLYADLIEGKKLSVAMDEMNLFPDMLLSVIRAGEESAKLDTHLLNMAEHYENEKRIMNKVRNAMIYPCILLTFSVVVIIAIFKFILPGFIENLRNMGNLPFITKVVIGITDKIAADGVYIVMVVLSLAILLGFILKLEKVIYRVDGWKIKIPYIGRLVQKIYTYRFASMLSYMYRDGIDIVEAVRLASKSMNNNYIGKQLLSAEERLLSGERLSQSLTGIQGFTPELVAIVKVGEETGRLDDMLYNLSLTLEEEANSSVDTLLSFVEPVMLILIGLMILPVVMAVILPTMSMYSSVNAM